MMFLVKVCLRFVVLMGRPRSVKSSMFTVPQISRSIDNRANVPKEISNTPMVREAKPVRNPLELPIVTLGKSRKGLLERLLARGRIVRSDSTFAELQQKKFFPTLVHSESDCMDEAELRSRFPKQGVNHKFFISGDAKFCFLLPRDSETVVVAQVLWEPKARMLC